MALEVWDPSTRKLNGPWDMTPVFQTIYPPAGQGWRATNPKKVGLATQYTWVRDVPETPKPATKPVAPTAAKPISLPTTTTGNTDSPTTSAATGSSTSDTPVQDFKLDEQAAAQKNYLDNALTDRLQKFQSLLNSVSL